jgi:fermentation-respiration switch protein FrsA (DUF1100 family)
LRHAAPADEVRTTRVPILPIHGTRDTNIPVRHSRELHALNPGGTVLWEVQGAEHVQSFSAQPAEYARKVTEWFQEHE